MLWRDSCSVGNFLSEYASWSESGMAWRKVVRKTCAFTCALQCEDQWGQWTWLGLPSLGLSLLFSCHSPPPSLLMLLSCKGTVYFPRAFCSTREKELFRPRVPQCNAVLQQGRIVAKFPLFGSFGWKDRLCNLAVIQCILQKEKNLTIHIPSWKILPYRVQGYPIAMLERLWYAHPLHDKKPTSYPTQTNW